MTYHHDAEKDEILAAQHRQRARNSAHRDYADAVWEKRAEYQSELVHQRQEAYEARKRLMAQFEDKIDGDPYGVWMRPIVWYGLTG